MMTVRRILTLSLFFLSPAAVFAVDQVQVLGPVKVSQVSGSTDTVQGTDAHDAAITGKPVLIGGYASQDEPTAVSTDGDAVRPWLTKDGRLVALIGHGDPEPPDTTNCTASGETVLISSPGASVSLYINKVTIHNAGSSNVTVSLKNGSGGTTFWKGELASEGGAAGISFGSRGWKLSADTQLIGNLSAAGDVDVNVVEYYIAP